MIKQKGNNMSNTSSTSGGVRGGFLLFLLFLGLRLGGVIDWSWWWVTAPLWIPIALFAIIVMIIVFLSYVLKAPSKVKYKEKRIK